MKRFPIIALFCFSAFGLQAQLNQVAVDIAGNITHDQSFSLTTFNYAHSISANERHLLEGGLSLAQTGNSGLNGGLLFKLLYRYRFDITTKWDLSMGMGYGNNLDFGGNLGFVTPTATVRYNITEHSALRLRLNGFLGDGALFLPSLGVAVRWPGDEG